MEVTQLTPSAFAIESASSADKRYIIRLEPDLDRMSCDCVAYVIKRNRNGGKGHFVTCKHTDEVTQFIRATQADEADFDNLRDSLIALRNSLAR